MNTTIMLVGVALALVAGPLGCFVVWRRMAYFGDGLAHSALLGVALGMIIGLPNQLGMVIIGIMFALALIWLRARRVLATDTLLGILAHAALSLGLVAMALLGAEEHDVHDYLLGNLENISLQNAIWIMVGAGLAFGLLLRLWTGLLLMTTSEELAHAEGIAVQRYEFLLMVLMGIVVAASIQVVGILLITSLLIIPASTARLFSNTPEMMAIGGGGLAGFAILAGTPLAQYLSLEAGPTIISLLVLIFLLLVGARSLTLINPNG